jgi:hypothetical protein
MVMNREDYLRELETAADDWNRSIRELATAANPLNQLRHGITKDWKWWLPGASVAGFAAARMLLWPRRPEARRTAPGAGASFWVPALLKILPPLLAQLAPVILSLRSDRKM